MSPTVFYDEEFESAPSGGLHVSIRGDDSRGLPVVVVEMDEGGGQQGLEWHSHIPEDVIRLGEMLVAAGKAAASRQERKGTDAR